MTVIVTGIAIALLLAACGSSGAPADGSNGPAATEAVATADAGGGATDAGAGGGSTTDALASLVAASDIEAALGSTPTPECATSTLTGAGSCVWTADDGSWLKVEDSTPAEMPDLSAFTERITGTLGLDIPVEGLGEAAFIYSGPRGTRTAVYLGEGRVAWVVLDRAGDAAAQQELVKRIAEDLIAGL